MAHRNRIGRVSTVAFTLVALALTSGRLRAAPNLVANGDLERPTERAQGVVRGTGDEAIFEFPGEKSFGRVIAHGENLGRQLASDLFVSYTAVGSAGGRTWGFAISGKNVNVDGDYDIAIWFDLKGKIRPNADYAYSVLAIPAGNAIPDLEMIAPAVWADGKLVGGKVTLSWDPEENTADGLVKRGVIRMPDFSVQTGGQALVLKLPKNFKDDLFFDRVSLREIDPALLTDEVPDMPTPTRYVILQDALERQIGEALGSPQC